MQPPEEQFCPLCGNKVYPSVRYRNYLCVDCVKRAVDENGRGLSFDNEAVSGGLVITYRDTREARENPMCWVDGQQCEAREAHMGGIVLLPYPSDYHGVPSS